jgi:hypothetical protein
MSEKYPRLRRYEVAERVAKATFRVYTSRSMGTAFLLMLGKGKDGGYSAVLATAWHVVEDVVRGTTLRVCDQFGKEIARSQDRNITVIQIGKGLDSAVVVITSKDEIFSQDLLLPLVPFDAQLRVGTEIGWMGYPGIVEPELCFFQGHVAGSLKNPYGYLVDGVAINGVSGGPVFDDRCQLAGLVSAYLPNRIDLDTTLPGVSWMVPLNYIFIWAQKTLKLHSLDHPEQRP